VEGQVAGFARAERLPAESRLRRVLALESLTRRSLIAPGVFLMLAVLVYPFGLAMYISTTNRVLGGLGKFIEMRIFLRRFQDSLFRQTVWNTIVYTVSPVVPKTVQGVIRVLLPNKRPRCGV
jgi:ABC-type sugar transport system permease subunit